MKRRHFFAGGLAATAATLLPRSTKAAEPRPKNIIFLVTDGMSSGVPAMAEMFSRQVRNSNTCWEKLRQAQSTTHTFLDMASLDSPVTDSAAASSAWGSGSLVFNGAINVLPDGRELTPICELAKKSGRSTGLISTATVTHATPAGFASRSASRRDEQGIAPQYKDCVDIILGGGIEFFDPADRDDGKNIIADYESAGFTFCPNREKLLSSKGSKRILGLFGKGFLPYTLDQQNSDALKAAVPTLAEMTRFALGELAENPNGFLLQVEAARVDHAAHANDIASLLWDQLAFDDVLAVAEEFAATHPDTLVIATSDHGNSNPGLNGLGAGYSNSDDFFRCIADANASYEVALNTLRPADGNPDAITPAAVTECVKKHFGWNLDEAEATALVSSLLGNKGQSWNRQLDNPYAILGELGGRRTGIGWCGTSHTSDWVEMLSFGAGSESFKGLRRSTDLFPILTAFMDQEIKNPSMTPADARAYAKEPNLEAVIGSPPKFKI